MENNHFLYRHIRLDKNEPFYIGIGTKTKQDLKYGTYKRAYDKDIRRNLIWKKITDKTKYEVEILIESYDYEFIKEKEKEFIKLYGRINTKTGTLANLTDGGEGVIGLIVSEETRKRSRMNNIGKKHPITSIKQNKKIRNKITNVVFDSMREAAKSINVTEGNFCRELKFHNSMFEYVDNNRKIKEIIKSKKSWKRVLNIETKELFKSLERAGKSINITGDQMRIKIKKEGINCKFKYYEG